MGKRRKARELAVQVLFHLEFSDGNPQDVFHLICANFYPADPVKAYGLALVEGVCEKKAELDRLIQEASRNWRLKRMPRVDRCVLRLAAYELMYVEDVPPKVSIDEAVEIVKRYGSEESGGFINGVLDNIYNRLLSRALRGEEGGDLEGLPR